MKVCPTNLLQPLLLAAGRPGAAWSPVLDTRRGYCEYRCNLCGQVCPTDAIRKLSLREKQKFKIGIAVFDKKICLPYAKGENCIVCEEHCPVPEKAIRVNEAIVNGKTRDAALRGGGPLHRVRHLRAEMPHRAGQGNRRKE